MPFPKAFLVCICFGCLSFSNVSCHETSENEHIIEWLTLSKTIPIAVSDMTATLIPEDAEHDLKGHIIIAGGCSHKDGNSEVLIDGVKNYFCNEVTDKAYAFNPRTETFTALSDLPSTRYRHAAAVIDGSLCLVGGRDVVDNIIKFIDCLNSVSKKWERIMELPSEYQTSDNGAFSHDGLLYVVGGYDPTYKIHKFTIAIDLKTNQIEKKADLNHARGDLSAIAYQYPDTNKSAAFAVGGFNETVPNCFKPVDKAEQYNFDTDAWTDIDSLGSARGDKSLVVLNHRIFAIGGEAKHADSCLASPTLDESGFSLVINDVESFDPTEDDPEHLQWIVESNLPYSLFRSASAPLPSTSTVYIFGGQQMYDANCACYKTSNQVYAFRQLDSGSNTAFLSSKAFSVLAFLCTTTSIMIAWY